jgi:hypothetical protein
MCLFTLFRSTDRVLYNLILLHLISVQFLSLSLIFHLKSDFFQVIYQFLVFLFMFISLCFCFISPHVHITCSTERVLRGVAFFYNVTMTGAGVSCSDSGNFYLVPLYIILPVGSAFSFYHFVVAEVHCFSKFHKFPVAYFFWFSIWRF